VRRPARPRVTSGARRTPDRAPADGLLHPQRGGVRVARRGAGGAPAGGQAPRGRLTAAAAPPPAGPAAPQPRGPGARLINYPNAPRTALTPAAIWSKYEYVPCS